MRFRRRERARRRHPSSRAHLDLASLWGEEDEAPAEPAPEGDALVAAVPDGDAPVAAVPDGDAPVAAVPDGDAPVVPVPDGDAPVVPVPDGDAPAVPVPVAPRRAVPEGTGGRRVGRVVVVAAVIAAGLITDRTLGTSGPRAAPVTPATPTMAAPGALSSTWLCPALGATAASPLAGSLVLANPSAAPVNATVTIVPAAGAPVVEHPRLEPYQRQTIALDAVATGAYAAATVVFDGAGGAVEQEVRGRAGDSVTPCATESSDHWYFPSGATDAHTSEYLSLYNPYPAPAIADLRFETDQGEAVPDAFRGLVVPGKGFIVIDIGARVRSRSRVATTVAVRGGRLVADELLMLSNPSGLVLTLGAPSLGTSWFYANGGVGPGVSERFDVFNPGTTEAEVTAAPVLDQGSADAFDLTVPPLGVVSLQVDQQARIPPGVGEAWVLTSANGVPVVAERVISSSRPAVQTGVVGTIGVPGTAMRWVFAAGSTAGGQDEWLVVFNPGGTTAHAGVVASGAGGAVRLPALVVPPATRLAVDVGKTDPGADVVLDLTADAPVVVERALFAPTSGGMSGGPGIAGA